MCDGKVLFHRHVSKTPEEAAALEERQSSKEALKAQRRATQVRSGVQAYVYAVCCVCGAAAADHGLVLPARI